MSAGSKGRVAFRALAAVPFVLLLCIVGIKLTAGDPNSPINKVPGVQTIYELGGDAPTTDVQATLPPTPTPTPTPSASLTLGPDGLPVQPSASASPSAKASTTKPAATKPPAPAPGESEGSGDGGENPPAPTPTPTPTPTPSPTPTTREVWAPGMTLNECIKRNGSYEIHFGKTGCRYTVTG